MHARTFCSDGQWYVYNLTFQSNGKMWGLGHKPENYYVIHQNTTVSASLDSPTVHLKCLHCTSRFVCWWTQCPQLAILSVVGHVFWLNANWSSNNESGNPGSGRAGTTQRMWRIYNSTHGYASSQPNLEGWGAKNILFPSRVPSPAFRCPRTLLMFDCNTIAQSESSIQHSLWKSKHSGYIAAPCSACGGTDRGGAADSLV